MDKSLADLFVAETCKAFAFLVTERSFAAPQHQVDDKTHFVFVTFMGKNLAIEFSLDWREGDIACAINRVMDGTMLDTYLDALDERDRHGTRVRESLTKLLVRRGVRERLLTPVVGLGFHDRMEATLGDFARMLEKHGQDILDDSPKALD